VRRNETGTHGRVFGKKKRRGRTIIVTDQDIPLDKSFGLLSRTTAQARTDGKEEEPSENVNPKEGGTLCGVSPRIQIVDTTGDIN